MVKKIRILNVSFDNELKGYEIPAFRGAIIEKVGRENTLFHNHLANDAFLYKYPLIQYKTIGRKPALICIDFGVDEIHKLFEKRDWSINISDRWLDMKIENLYMNQFTMQVWDRLWDYSIVDWVALNAENYKKYMEIESLVQKISFLENILKGNILAFAKGIEWNVEKTIDLHITDLVRSHAVSMKGQKVLAFDLTFKTNVFLPNFIGLGKSVSLGFGTVKQMRNMNN